MFSKFLKDFYHRSGILERCHTSDTACIWAPTSQDYVREQTSTVTGWNFPISVDFWRDCWCSTATDWISMKFPEVVEMIKFSHSTWLHVQGKDNKVKMQFSHFPQILIKYSRSWISAITIHSPLRSTKYNIYYTATSIHCRVDSWTRLILHNCSSISKHFRSSRAQWDRNNVCNHNRRFSFASSAFFARVWDVVYLYTLS